MCCQQALTGSLKADDLQATQVLSQCWRPGNRFQLVSNDVLIFVSVYDRRSRMLPDEFGCDVHWQLRQMHQLRAQPKLHRVSPPGIGQEHIGRPAGGRGIVVEPEGVETSDQKWPLAARIHRDETACLTPALRLRGLKALQAARKEGQDGNKARRWAPSGRRGHHTTP